MKLELHFTSGTVVTLTHQMIDIFVISFEDDIFATGISWTPPWIAVDEGRLQSYFTVYNVGYLEPNRTFVSPICSVMYR